MAHLVDGVLSGDVVVATTVLAVGGVAIGLRSMKSEDVPQVALMTAALFVSSLVRLPIGPASVHPLLAGMAGLLLGWRVFPAFLVALLLQALFFGFGGVTVLGANVLNMALPGVLCFYLFGSRVRDGAGNIGLVAAAAAGALGVVMVSSGIAAELALSGKALIPAAKLILLAHLPVAAVEAAFTVAVVAFLRKVKPEALALRYAGETPANA